MASGEPPLVGSFRIDADHPSLAGHFPGNPIVPGVVLLDHVLALALPGHAATALLGVKFAAVVRPGDSIEVLAGPASAGRIGFFARHGGTLVLRGSAAVAP